MPHYGPPALPWVMNKRQNEWKLEVNEAQALIFGAAHQQDARSVVTKALRLQLIVRGPHWVRPQTLGYECIGRLALSRAR